MSVGSFFKFSRDGKEHHMQGRRNTDWATLVGHIARQYAPPTPLEGPMVFVAVFYLPRPQAVPRLAANLPIKRPDLDNLVHKLTDRLNGVFWKDDSQVVDWLIRKRYALDDRPGVEITVAPTSAKQLMAEFDQLALDLDAEGRTPA